MSDFQKLSFSNSSILVKGVLDDDEVDSIRGFLKKHKREMLDRGKVTLDFSESPGIDAVAAMVLLDFFKELARAGVRVRRRGTSKSIENIFKTLYEYDSRGDDGKRKRTLRDFFIQLGESVSEFAETMSELIHFLFETVGGFACLIIRPARIRWGMVLYYMEESGYKAIPIVAVLTWLLGVVLGYQAGYQMRVFGAETFMPALLAYSITWEIGPMLAAVLVAGRSGSAYAAEIGTMQVREEVDALRVMGFDTFDYLVTPKMIALLCVMPFLVLLANLSGIFGGLLAGVLFLGLPADTYIQELGKALIPLDILWGMIKSLIYAVIIANVGSFMGMKVKGGASEVGKATTSAVVLSIFMVIIADALLSLLFVHIRPGLTM